MLVIDQHFDRLEEEILIEIRRESFTVMSDNMEPLLDYL